MFTKTLSVSYKKEPFTVLVYLHFDEEGSVIVRIVSYTFYVDQYVHISEDIVFETIYSAFYYVKSFSRSCARSFITRHMDELL